MEKLCIDYENICLLGDFNVEVEEKNISEFMSAYSLRNSVKQKNCFKNSEIRSSLDLFLTNFLRSFQKSNAFKTGLFNFNKFTTTVLKQYFPQQKSKVINYSDYRKFRDNQFRAQFDSEILKHDINNTECQHFVNIFIEILNKHAPMKQKYHRRNQGRFRTKKLT